MLGALGRSYLIRQSRAITTTGPPSTDLPHTSVAPVRLTGSSVTELIYRKQIRPVIDDGATAIDRRFPDEDG